MSLSKGGLGRSQSVLYTNRRRLSHGKTFTIDGNNLIVAQPVGYRPAFPWRGVMLILVCCFSMKAFVMGIMSDADYAARLEQLNEGVQIERVAAWMMQPDPVSSAIAGLWAPSRH
ncbi:hypothetical protein SAMN05428995_101903 [Loktanella sp. DSM 29012]|uniref:Uncharacterized protein n=1 Tax=Loktanella gaetbuli TaxID=2881335 RepID=A0ABS8BWV4_9RHOB|nr:MULTISPECIES: hypothetical protein [Loktanella]MCB5200207.1 hypothetical protein [Loktanella gaetbuli]SEP82056.1 hypothetical protein SAMN05428995_101903 [Loktanella sp. DSM 29012]